MNCPVCGRSDAELLAARMSLTNCWECGMEVCVSCAKTLSRQSGMGGYYIHYCPDCGEKARHG